MAKISKVEKVDTYLLDELLERHGFELKRQEIVIEQILEEIRNKAHRIGFDLKASRIASQNELRMLAMRMNQFSDYLWDQLNQMEGLEDE